MLWQKRSIRETAVFGLVIVLWCISRKYNIISSKSSIVIQTLLYSVHEIVFLVDPHPKPKLFQNPIKSVWTFGSCWPFSVGVPISLRISFLMKMENLWTLSATMEMGMVNVFMLNNYVMIDMYIWIGLEHITVIVLTFSCDKIWIAHIDCINKIHWINWILAAADQWTYNNCESIVQLICLQQCVWRHFKVWR